MQMLACVFCPRLTLGAPLSEAAHVISPPWNVSFAEEAGARLAQTKWEDLAIDDMDVRLKWAGLFHRKKRTPGRFMMRLKVGAAPRTLAPPTDAR